MVQKQSVYGRMAQLSMANVELIVENASDPATCIAELIDSFDEVAAQAHELVTNKVGKLRLAEADHAEDVASAVEWEREAQSTKLLATQAAEQNDALREQQLTSLSIYATSRKVSFESWARQAASHIAAQSARVKELRTTLTELERRLTLLRSRQVEISSDFASLAPPDGETEPVNVFDPTSELSRFRERVHNIQSTMG